MTHLLVYLEEDQEGRCLAHVPDLAGCAVAGASREEALSALPTAVTAYLHWCARHGEPLAENYQPEFMLAEVLSGRPWKLGGAGGLFAADRAPLGDAELRAYLRRAGYARSDMVATARRLRETGARPGLDETLIHVADTEVWLLSRLGQRLAAAEPADRIQRLIDVRSRSTEALLRLALRQRDLVYVPTTNPSDDPNEAWTVRKVLRRMIEHELDHLRQLES